MYNEQDDYVFDFEKGCFVKMEETVFNPEFVLDFINKEEENKNNIKKEI